MMKLEQQAKENEQRIRADERGRIKTKYNELRKDHLAEESFWLSGFGSRELSKLSLPDMINFPLSDPYAEAFRMIADAQSALVDAVKGIQNWIARHDT